VALLTRHAALLVLLLPAVVIAEEHATLSVKPLLCIIDERQPACDLEFAIIWQAFESGYYCVRADLDDRVLRCWQESIHGSTTDERTVTVTFSYHLQSGEVQSGPLAAATVEVLQKNSDDRRRRRRTRHVWDLL
jgi:hypothetical protein